MKKQLTKAVSSLSPFAGRSFLTPAAAGVMLKVHRSSMSKHLVEGVEVEVSSIAVSRYFWMAVDFLVVVENERVFRSPKKLEGFGGKVDFDLGGNQSNTKYQLAAIPPISLFYGRYSLLKDGVEIGRGSVRAKNWYVFYSLIVAIGLVFYGCMQIT